MVLPFLFSVVVNFIFFVSPLIAKEVEPKPELPTREFYRYKMTSGEPLHIKGTTRFWIGGDVMFNWGVRESMLEEDKMTPFRSLSPILQDMDLVMLNLETPILEKKPAVDKIKPYVFFAEPKNLSILKELGVQLVFLGNNHTMDFGAQGLEETLEHTKVNKIASVGAGKNLREAFKPFVWKKNKSEFAIYSVSGVGESRLFAGPNRPGVAPLNSEFLKEEVGGKNRISILSFHWGVEYSPMPTPEQRQLAKELFQSGAKVIVGHHPHVPQGIEVFPGGGVCIYSLGNLFFGSKNQYLKHNISVVLHFQEKKLIAVEVIPLYGKQQSHNGPPYFEPLDGNEAEEFLKEYALLCERLGTQLHVQGGRGYVFLK